MEYELRAGQKSRVIAPVNRAAGLPTAETALCQVRPELVPHRAAVSGIGQIGLARIEVLLNGRFLTYLEEDFRLFCRKSKDSPVRWWGHDLITGLLKQRTLIGRHHCRTSPRVADILVHADLAVKQGR